MSVFRHAPRMRALLSTALLSLALISAPARPPANHHGAAHPVADRHTGPRSAVASDAIGGAGYPRLANYNGLRYDWQVPFFTSDDLIVARRGAPVRELLRVHPHALALLYERSLQEDLDLVQDHYGLNLGDVPPGWWLVTAGSRLVIRVDNTSDIVTVTDPRPFAPCQDVLVDGESMHIWGVAGHRLYVERGYHSVPAAHRVGARVAVHYSYRKDLSNCSLDRLRPWSFNMSSLCPRWHGQTWADYLAHRIAVLVRRDGWRGVFYDNLQDFPPDPRIDVNGDGRADGGIVRGVNVWRAGQRALLAETKRLLPGAPLLVNGDLRIDGLAQGREMEGFPLIPGTALYAAIDAYEYDTEAGQGHSIVNPDNVTRLTPASESAEATVGVSLLGDGYAAYDRGWIVHGDPWWFDEYDGGQGSALTRRLDAAATLVPVAHPRRFRTGDVVLVDQEAMEILRVLAGSLLVRRGLEGTTPIWHMERTTVTTARQRAAGHGYLGRPLGPARLVQIGDWSGHALPLTLVRDNGGRGGRLRRPDAQLVDRNAVIHVSAPLSYRPDAAGLTLLAPPDPLALRTLVFMARGPAGSTVRFDAGDVPSDATGASGEAAGAALGGTSVPLALRSAWHRYAIPVGGTGHFRLGVGRVGGQVSIKGLRLLGTQAFMLRRDFAHGIVLVNPTDRTQHLRLERPYRVLSGDANPWSNNGRLVRYIAVARYRSAILLNG